MIALRASRAAVAHVAECAAITRGRLALGHAAVAEAFAAKLVGRARFLRGPRFLRLPHRLRRRQVLAKLSRYCSFSRGVV